MSEIAFIKQFSGSVHGSLDEAMEELTQEQAHWKPADQINHIAFIAWHYTRTVDNLTRFVFRRQPTLWMEGKWDERFGLDSRAQGTGMSHEDAGSLRIPDLPAFRDYMKEVWREAQAYLDTVTAEELERVLTVRPLGELSIREILGTSILTHGYTHLGEIWMLRSLQGLRSSPM